MPDTRSRPYVATLEAEGPQDRELGAATPDRQHHGVPDGHRRECGQQPAEDRREVGDLTQPIDLDRDDRLESVTAREPPRSRSSLGESGAVHAIRERAHEREVRHFDARIEAREAATGERGAIRKRGRLLEGQGREDNLSDYPEPLQASVAAGRPRRTGL